MQALFDIFFGFFRVSGHPDEKANPAFPESGRRNGPDFRSAGVTDIPLRGVLRISCLSGRTNFPAGMKA
jgi:hypothetical protein